MWTCKICGYPDNRNNNVHCGNCGKPKFKGDIDPIIVKCRVGCREGGFVKDPNDIYGMNWIKCPMLGHPSCRYF